MRKHAMHLWMCGAMVVGAVAVVALTGRTAVLVPAMACVLMMVVMMQMMSGGRS